MTERLYRAAPALFRSLERRPLSNLSVSHPLDSSPGRGALGREISFSMNPMESVWKQNGMPRPLLTGEVASSVSEDDGEVVQSSTCVIPLTLKASFVQPLRRLRRQLPWQGSPWQRGFVFDETDLVLLENATECQSLPY